MRYEAARFFYRLLTLGQLDKARGVLAIATSHYADDPFWQDVASGFERYASQ